LLNGGHDAPGHHQCDRQEYGAGTHPFQLDQRHVNSRKRE
jgi:hypothetical protein